MTHRARPARLTDRDELVRMRRRLFPDCDDDQHRRELDQLFGAAARAPGTVGNSAHFVLDAPDGAGLCGFAEVMIRSHAEGAWDQTADGTLGVAHLEAWWVDEPARRTGAGRALVAACEQWTLAQGLSLLASDAELDNTLSQTAHTALGFTEVERAVHYIKKLPPR